MATTPDSTGTNPDRFDDLFWQSETEPITEDDAFLTRIVETADLPALLAAIAAATRYSSLLTDDLMPPLTPVDTAGHPHGGMSPAQQERARAVALAGLQRLRDEAITSVDLLPDADVTAILRYLTGGRENWYPTLKHELDLAADKLGDTLAKITPPTGPSTTSPTGAPFTRSSSGPVSRASPPRTASRKPGCPSRSSKTPRTSAARG